MELKKIVAIVRSGTLEDVEASLRRLGVPGITVDRVKGFGEDANYLTPDWMSGYARIEVFTDESQAPEIIDTILAAAHTGTAGDGIAAVLPVDHVYRIRDHCDLHSLHHSHTDSQSEVRS